MSVERAKEQLELSEGRWESAIGEHAQPPPDAGFARRLRALADAAAQEQAAYGYAAEEGFGWRPGPAWLPPRELRSATWRDTLAPARGVGAVRCRSRGVVARADRAERGGDLAGVRGVVRGRVRARRRGRPVPPRLTRRRRRRLSALRAGLHRPVPPRGRCSSSSIRSQPGGIPTCAARSRTRSARASLPHT